MSGIREVSNEIGYRRRLWAGIFLLLLLFPVASIAGPLSIQFGAVEAVPGGEVSIPVTIQGEGEMSAILISFLYDSTEIVQLGGEIGAALGTRWNVSTFGSSQGKGTEQAQHDIYLYKKAGEPSLQLKTTDGAVEIYRLTLKLSKSVEVGQSLSLTVRTGSVKQGDNYQDSYPDAVTIGDMVVNVLGSIPPKADAGANANGYLGYRVVLSGAGSSDPSGEVLDYQWTMSSLPQGSTITLANATAESPYFVPDKVGEYVVELVVTNQSGVSSEIDSVTVTVESPPKPIADIQLDTTDSIWVGSSVSMSGAGSTDALGESLSYQWSFIERPTESGATFINGASEVDSFTADKPGVYKVSLKVTSSTGRESDPAIYTLEILSPPLPYALIHVNPAGAVWVNDVVSFSGEDSTDSLGGALTYQWELTDTPLDSQATISDTATQSVSLMPDKAGRYEVKLTVEAAAVGDAPVRASNPLTKQLDVYALPVAVAEKVDAGVARLGDTVSLDGSDSTDSQGESLSYSWLVESVPEGSSMAGQSLSDQSMVMLTPDVMGDYRVSLMVSNQSGKSSSRVYLEFTVYERIPVANISASPNQGVRVNDNVLLSGDQSINSDGGTTGLSYLWEILAKPAGSSLLISNVTQSSFSVAPDVAGTFRFRLVVTNQSGTPSAPAEIELLVTERVPPTATITLPEDAVYRTGGSVVLSGVDSTDTDGESLTYQWSLIQKPAGSQLGGLVNSSSDMASFSSDVAGSYLIQLVVRNESGLASSPVQKEVTVYGSIALTAALGGRHEVMRDSSFLLPLSLSGFAEHDRVTGLQFELLVPTAALLLDVSDSIQPATQLETLGWGVELGEVVEGGSYNRYPVTLQTSNTAGSVNGDINPLAQITLKVLAEATPQEYQVTLENVTSYYNGELIDGNVLAQEARVVVLDSLPPVADAGKDQQVEVGKKAFLDGSASYDPNGDSFSYSWKILGQPQGSTAELLDANTASPDITPDKVGDYQFELTITDWSGLSDVDEVTVTATATPPVARAGSDQIVRLGESVTISGVDSTDSAAGTLTFQWSLAAKPNTSAVVLQDGAAPSFQLTPDVEGLYQLQLIVISSTGAASESDLVNVIAYTTPEKPQASAADRKVFVGDTVILDGGGSVDPGGATLTAYQWVLQSQPAGSSPKLVGANSEQLELTPDIEGEYALELTVTNSAGVESEPLQITVLAITPSSIVMDLGEVSGGVGQSVLLPVSLAGVDQTITSIQFDLAYPQAQITLGGVAQMVLPGGEGTTWSGELTVQGVQADSATTHARVTLTDSGSGLTSDQNELVKIPLLIAQDLSASEIVVSIVNGSVDLKNGNTRLDYVTTLRDGSVTVLSTAIPVADAGIDQQVYLGEQVTLDGSGSTDPDQQTLSYQWSLISAPNGSTMQSSSLAAEVAPHFTPDLKGIYQLSLVVTNQSGDVSDADEVMVTVLEKDVVELSVGSVTLYTDTSDSVGLAIDLEGVNKLTTSLSFSIQYPTDVIALGAENEVVFLPALPDGWTASFGTVSEDAAAGVTVVEVTLTTTGSGFLGSLQGFVELPFVVGTSPVEGTHTVSLVDGSVVLRKNGDQLPFQYSIQPGSVVVSHPLKPVANPGVSKIVQLNKEMLIDGSGSSDARGEVLTYQWEIVEQPADSDLKLTDPASVSFSLTPTVLGEYKFRLVVTNQSGSESDPAEVVMTVKESVTAFVPRLFSKLYTDSGTEGEFSLQINVPRGQSLGEFTIDIAVDKGVQLGTPRFYNHQAGDWSLQLDSLAAAGTMQKYKLTGTMGADGKVLYGAYLMISFTTVIEPAEKEYRVELVDFQGSGTVGVILAAAGLEPDTPLSLDDVMNNGPGSLSGSGAGSSTTLITQEYTLRGGWSLVGFPIKLGEKNSVTTLIELIPEILSIWHWDGAQWLSYVKGTPIFLNSIQNIDSGKGYFLELDPAMQARTVTLSGSPSTTGSLSLIEGWNMVSFNSTNEDVLGALELLQGVSIWSFQDQQWRQYAKELGGLNEPFIIEPGVGYLLQVNPNT